MAGTDFPPAIVHDVTVPLAGPKMPSTPRQTTAVCRTMRAPREQGARPPAATARLLRTKLPADRFGRAAGRAGYRFSHRRANPRSPCGTKITMTMNTMPSGMR